MKYQDLPEDADIAEGAEDNEWYKAWRQPAYLWTKEMIHKWPFIAAGKWEFFNAEQRCILTFFIEQRCKKVQDRSNRKLLAHKRKSDDIEFKRSKYTPKHVVDRNARIKARAEAAVREHEASLALPFAPAPVPSDVQVGVVNAPEVDAALPL